jgi:ParB/RepB/Spo0J family partition protein
MKNKVLQPLLVVEVDDKGLYEVVHGTKRLQASRLAGLKTLPCKIVAMPKDHPKENLRILNLNENIWRRDIAWIQRYEYFEEMRKVYEDMGEDPVKRLDYELHHLIGSSSSMFAFGKMSKELQNSIRNDDDFDTATGMHWQDFSDDRILDTLRLIHQQGPGSKRNTIQYMIRLMKENEKLSAEEAFEEASTSPRSTKVTITIDGEWNASLTEAVVKCYTTKQEYVKEAMMHRLITEGFHVKPDGMEICQYCGIYQETDRYESGDKYVQLCGMCAQAGPPNCCNYTDR